jgi:glycolate oxidase
VIGVETRDHDRLDDNVTMLGQLLDSLGAMDLYVLEGNSAQVSCPFRRTTVSA